MSINRTTLELKQESCKRLLRCYCVLIALLETAFIEPGSPWENGYIESFNGKFRDELLNGEIFDTVLEDRVVTEQWRKHYNSVRPHSPLGYRPPAQETFIPYQVANA